MKGTYCLVINLSRDVEIKVGKVLGEIKFKKGCYLYVGSAMNSLEARVRRHLSNDKKKHWHIDYLLLNDSSNVENVIVNISEKRIECMLAKLLGKNQEVVPKFGCSDCNCKSHLIYFKNSKIASEKIKEAYDTLEMPYKTLNEPNHFL